MIGTEVLVYELLGSESVKVLKMHNIVKCTKNETHVDILCIFFDSNSKIKISRYHMYLICRQARRL